MKQPLERPMKQPLERPQEWPMKQPLEWPMKQPLERPSHFCASIAPRLHCTVPGARSSGPAIWSQYGYLSDVNKLNE